MKRAIIGLDGGGSNLRIVIADRDTGEKLYEHKIKTGTNLSTVPDRQEALDNIKNLILTGYRSIPQGYFISGIGLSSAGTEIEQNVIDLNKVLVDTVEDLKQESYQVRTLPPQCFVTNDIDILLHSADMALVGGTGTVGAVKFKDIKPYDNVDLLPMDDTYEEPEEVIYKFDGDGEFIGDKGSGYWIAKEVLTKVAQIENLSGFMNHKTEFVRVPGKESYLRDLVYDKLFSELGISKEEAQRMLKEKKIPQFVSLVYKATEEKGRPFGRAKVGNLFGEIAEQAAIYGDEAANDILLHASKELFKNVRAGYEMAGFGERGSDDKEFYTLLLSGSVLTNNKIVRHHLEQMRWEECPNLLIKINDEEPVWSTINFVKSKLDAPKKGIELGR